MGRTKDKGKTIETQPRKKRNIVIEETTRTPDDFMGLTKLTDAQKNKWRNLANGRVVQVTRFLCEDTLRKLGLHGLVSGLLNNIGLGGFLGKSAGVYKRVTLEFLATIERREENGIWSVRFNVNDITRVMSYAAAREYLGVSEPRGEWSERDRTVETFFYELTGKFMQKPYVVMKSLSHPAWKLLYRGLSMTFYANGEPAQMNALQFATMECALQSNTVIPDWVDLFFRRCEALGVNGNGNIPVGGMVTLLVENFVRNHPKSVGKMEGPLFYDRFFLYRYDSFERISGQNEALTFTYGGDRSFRCAPGVAFPAGPYARDWRMPFVADMTLRDMRRDMGERVSDDEEEQQQEQQDDDQQGDEDHQMGEQFHAGSSEGFARHGQDQSGMGGAFNYWGDMRAYLDAQYQREAEERERRYREECEAREAQNLMWRTRFDYVDRRWDAQDDRLEALEDRVETTHRMVQQQQLWIQQSEPRQFEPVPDEHFQEMIRRAERRRQRQAAREAQFPDGGFGPRY